MSLLKKLEQDDDLKIFVFFGCLMFGPAAIVGALKMMGLGPNIEHINPGAAFSSAAKSADKCMLMDNDVVETRNVFPVSSERECFNIAARDDFYMELVVFSEGQTVASYYRTLSRPNIFHNRYNPSRPSVNRNLAP